MIRLVSQMWLLLCCSWDLLKLLTWRDSSVSDTDLRNSWLGLVKHVDCFSAFHRSSQTLPKISDLFFFFLDQWSLEPFRLRFLNVPLFALKSLSLISCFSSLFPLYEKTCPCFSLFKANVHSPSLLSISCSIKNSHSTHLQPFPLYCSSLLH